MYEQSEIHPYRRAVEKKIKNNGLDRLKILTTFIRRHVNLSLLLSSATAFLLARAQILGGLYPFALAYIAAQSLRKKEHVMYALLGALLAIPTTLQGLDMAAQAGVYILLATLVLLYPNVPKQLIVIPVLAATVNIVVKGMAMTFIDGSDYNVMVVLFESMIVGGLTPVLYVAMRSEPWNKDGDPLSAEEYVCFLLFVMALIMGVGDIGYNFITAKGIISRYCILFAAWMGGPGAGASVGVLVGIIPSLSNMIAPSIVGNFAFSGLLAGTFKTFSKVGVIIGFILANLLLSIYYLNQPAVLGAFAECAIAAFFLLLTPRKVYYRLAVLSNEDKSKTNKQEEISLREITGTRLREVAEIFNDMSRSFSHAASQEVNEDEELNKLFGTVNRYVCQDCAIHKICWEHDSVKTCKSILELFKHMDVKGFINIKYINPDIKKRCSRLREMIATVSCLYENYCINTHWQKKYAENRELLSSQMRGMSTILAKLSSEMSGSIKVRHSMQNNLAHELEQQGLHVDKITVASYFDKSTEIVLEKDTCHGLFDCPKIVSSAVSAIAGREFTVFEGVCSLKEETKQCRFRLVPKGNLRIADVSRQIAKEASGISGDTIQSTLLKDGRHLLLVSDGMGGGSSAAMESKTTVTLLEQLLEAGFDKDTALKTVNAVLIGRHGTESFATVDLAVIDLFSGETDFVKIAAPPSFIKRGSKVIALKTQNLPIGIVNSLEVETIRETVRKEDFLIMVTDGVLDSIPAYNKEDWLAERIREIAPESPDELADYLLNKVISITCGKIKDDVTIVVGQVY